jgi:hypothetical protein
MADSGLHDAGFGGRAWRRIQCFGEGTKSQSKQILMQLTISFKRRSKNIRDDEILGVSEIVF